MLQSAKRSVAWGASGHAVHAGNQQRHYSQSANAHPSCCAVAASLADPGAGHKVCRSQRIVTKITYAAQSTREAVRASEVGPQPAWTSLGVAFLHSCRCQVLRTLEIVVAVLPASFEQLQGAEFRSGPAHTVCNATTTESTLPVAMRYALSGAFCVPLYAEATYTSWTRTHRLIAEDSVRTWRTAEPRDGLVVCQVSHP